MSVYNDDTLPGTGGLGAKARFTEPTSIEDANRRLVGTPTVRGLLGDIEDIEAQLSDETKRNQTAWRAGARRVLRLKNEEARYLRSWIKRKRAERKIRDVVGGVEMNSTALLQAARNKLEKVLTDEEDRELLHAIDLYLQHIA